MQSFEKFYKKKLNKKYKCNLSNLRDEGELQLDLLHDRTKGDNVSKVMDEIKYIWDNSYISKKCKRFR